MTTTYRLLGFLLLVSAFLLFLVQPMISKMLLPLLGGTPAVWTTSMLFFQVLLLGGYCWAHIMIRYMPFYAPPILQLIMTAAGFVLIHSTITETPDFENGNAIFWQLKIMFTCVGLPYFVLATNAPLYQALYKRFTEKTHQGKSPYALYSLSNIGSFAALLSYPFIIEPTLALEKQFGFWQYGYGFLCLLVVGSAVLFFNLSRKNAELLKVEKQNHKTKAHSPFPTIKDTSLWLFLAFIPSSLMLGVTTHVTTDVASVPLLWIIPLAFYLGSFVIAFAEPPLWWAKNEKRVFDYALISIILMVFSLIYPLKELMWLPIIIHYGGFFMVATFCHSLLARHKAEPDHLTYFFIIVSVGGALGGIFNALIAYQLFSTASEYAAVLIAFLFFILLSHKWVRVNYERYIAFALIIVTSLLFVIAVKFPVWITTSFLVSAALVLIFRKTRLVLAAFTIAMMISLISVEIFNPDTYRTRNLFGVLKIVDNHDSGTRRLIHGTTVHGVQKLPIKDHPEQTGYYESKGPLGDIFGYLDSQDNKSQKVAILGLGIGATGCYTREGRTFDFYEIDKDVVEIAKNPEFFTFMSSCQPNTEVIMGDARISLQKQQDNTYDFIMLDVFSSDAIPVHFLTTEAFALYKAKVKKGGIIGFHISNRFFDLTPIIANLASAHGLSAIKKSDPGGGTENPTYFPTIHMVVGSEESLEALSSGADNWISDGLHKPNQKLWTDNYVNIFQVMKF